MPVGDLEVIARLDDVFKKYSDAPVVKRKTKKKADSLQDGIVLNSFKENLDLKKDSEDHETILHNTYDPAQSSPRFTKNKRREEQATEKPNNVSTSQEELRLTRKKKKKSKRNLPLNPSTAPQASDILSRAQTGCGQRGRGESERNVEAEDPITKEVKRPERDVAAATEVMLNNEVGKKKKKKSSQMLEADARELSEEPSEAAETKAENSLEDSTKAKEKRKKKRKEMVAEVPVMSVPDASLVLGVCVHRTDRLKNDLLLSHPMVKVHVVDERTGQYVKKEDVQRPVSSFYEHESVDHILPIITQPYDFKKHKSNVPEWEEQIIFNERFTYLTQDDLDSPRVLLFFEVLDFVSMEEARVHEDQYEHGFRKIAWAFLKLVGTNGVLNVNSKLRLQLYYPPPRTKKMLGTVEIVEWWRRFPRNRYFSTLYVTVKGLKLPEHVDPSMRSMMALQQERGSSSFTELYSEITRKNHSQLMASKPDLVKWDRVPGQMCHIPNKPMLSLNGGQMGCFNLRFSHDGRMLATACADRDAFPIIVYEIPSGKVLTSFCGHLSPVYDLSWSRDDCSLLTASSDGTVRVWNTDLCLASAQKVLPHPSFVYCAQFHPCVQSLVVTGGYDSLLRVWCVDVQDINGHLFQEFEGHKAFVNTLCFDPEGLRMFSADSMGHIIVWNIVVEEGSHHQTRYHWSIEREIKESDLSGIPISMLQVHPNGRRLLIHAKDSVLRVMDLRIMAVKKYTGATNYREQVQSTFTPCSSFIFSGSEDGLAYVWNAETGDQLAVYSELGYTTTLRTVAFHPHENMVAFCAFGSCLPIHVYIYDQKVSQLEVEGFKKMKTGRTPDKLAAFEDTGSSAVDRFASAARVSLRMQRVKDKLDSVLRPQQEAENLECLYGPGIMSQIRRSLSQKMDLNASLTPSVSTYGHEHQLHISGVLSSVGPSLTPGKSTKSLKVVSLYDYCANRSDELTVCRGDIIHVLYKDNDSWWFGQLSSGQQGYFPASYVAEERDFRREISQVPQLKVDRTTPTRVFGASTSEDLQVLPEQESDPAFHIWPESHTRAGLISSEE
ncbi:jouberin isoform X2 [Denticeps clupeoides]|uniref:jouberin isoform X2 n=1 Tax=Denticeps clupeoides TaxID=299321 RepID=UPI0010A3C8B9|nr:jouberin isoform X2 [Denticeps clupeoides]